MTIDYDGSGDSGQIESIEAWTFTNEKIPLPSSHKLQLAFGNPDDPLTEITSSWSAGLFVVGLVPLVLVFMIRSAHQHSRSSSSVRRGARSLP